MGKINNYSKDTEVTANDKWVGSDFENFGRTKNFSPTSIAKYLNDNNVINIGADLRYRYQTLDPGELRNIGTISFESEIGASVLFSSITTFLLSKRSLKQNDVSQYLQFLNGGSIIINSADNQNLFGFYNITGLSEYVTDTNFYVVTLEYIDGNGSIVEDTDYIFSLITDKYSNETPTQVNSDWNATSGVAEILNKPTLLSDFTNDEGFITIADVPEVNGIPAGGTTGQILTKASDVDYNAIWQENYADWTSVVKHTVKNNGNEILLKGSPVYSTGSNGTNILVGYAGNQLEATSSKTMGLLQSQLNTNGSQSTGFVITEGLLGGLNTSGTTAGDPVWLGPTGTLIYGLVNKPYAPNHLVFIGIVTKVSSGNGEIFVKVQNGFELNEIHDVDLKTTTPQVNEVLGFDGSLWKNKTISSILGYTPFQLPSLTSGSVLFSNGTTIAQDNAAFFWDNTNKSLKISAALSSNTEAPLIVKNLTAYSAPNYNQYSQLWKNSTDTVIGFFRADGRLYTSNDVNSNYFVGNITGSNASPVFRGPGGGILFPGSNSVAIATASTERLRVTSTGEVVIGATTAGARLDVRAQGALSTDIAFRVRNSADTQDIIKIDGASQATFNVGATNPILFGKNITYPTVPSISMNNTLSDTLMAGFFADNLNFYINSPNRIIIRGSGNANNSSFVFSNGAMGQGYGAYATNPSTSNGIFVLDKLGVGTNTPASSAKVQIDSTTQGLLTPRMTTAQKNAISSPATGLIVYDTSLLSLYQYNGTAWTVVGGALQGLDSVLTEGSISTIGISVGDIYSYDTVLSSYGRIKFDDGGVMIDSPTFVNPLFLNNGTGAVSFSNGTYAPTLNFAGVGNNIYTFQNANGTLAFLSDIPSAITLTTTGTSGPATLVGSTLNIPQYGGGGGSTPVKLTSQTLTEGSWTLSGGYYTYTFSNVNIDATCDVSVTPQNASYLTAYNAQVLPFVDVAAGVATFYSQFPPQDDMVVDIVITQTT